MKTASGVMDAESGAKPGSAAASYAAPLRAAPAVEIPGWWEYLGPRGAARLAVIVGLFGWLYFDHLLRLLAFWQQPDWSHGFLIPVFCLYAVHRMRGRLLVGENEGSFLGLPLILFSVFVYAFAIYRKIGYPQPLTMLGVVGGLVLLLRGWRTLRLTAFPIAFFALAIPPPVRLYREVTQPLQQFAARVAAVILNSFPGTFEIERAGIKIAYYMNDGTEGVVLVAGACSGMRSLMAFIAMGLAVAYLTRRPMWQRIVLAVSVMPVAVFCNVLRVIITGSFQMYGHPELSTGTPHTVLGLAMFGLGFSIFLGGLWVLEHLFVEDPGGFEGAAGRAEGSGR